ncbi:[Pyruvate dehydrogenase [acetyl-transferring]]-phosphatase 1, mitochondrial [Nowakowskiella sp. JEL0407]|nr:[Pyruvate dehydrogenase [acetyl-transferring]]-phosphatase 1, mitochondrial [Nowakowskiella sp. JEL0407]
MAIGAGTAFAISLITASFSYYYDSSTLVHSPMQKFNTVNVSQKLIKSQVSNKEPEADKTTSSDVLKADQIDQIIQQNQFSIVVNQFGTLISKIFRVDVDFLAANNPIEDRYLAHILTKECGIFGVLDGHWDVHCVDTVKEYLPSYVLSELTEAKMNSHALKETEYRKVIMNALTRAFVRLDRDILDIPRRVIPNFDALTPEEIAALPESLRIDARNQILCALTGSCAVLAYIDGDNLYVANTGDSRAVIGYKNNSGWQAKALTEDHQASNPSELAQLKSEHPGEEATVAYKRKPNGPLRVIGGMMPSRAFGDAKFKWPLDWHSKVDALIASVPRVKHSFKSSPHCLTPPYMTAKPEVRHHKINPRDSFMVIASDGIFDCLSNAEVVAAVGQYIDSISTNRKAVSKRGRSVDISDVIHISEDFKDDGTTKLLHKIRDNNASAHLIRTALSNGKGEKEISRLLDLPVKSRRDHRDDMTVVVVFFDNDEIKKHSIDLDKMKLKGLEGVEAKFL